MAVNLTAADLAEAPNETLVLWASLLHAEADRRRVKIETIRVHPGNAAPLLVRLIRKIPGLPPGDLAKLETLVDSWIAARIPKSEAPTP